MKTVFATDWSPHIEQAARRIAPVLVAVYCAGWALGKWLHRLNDQLAGCSTPPPQPSIVQRQAAIATASNVAPPRTGIIHISDPMARAVRMVRTDGKSQRLAASLCGVSRSSLQRALKA
jgi:hypothetical protein